MPAAAEALDFKEIRNLLLPYFFLWEMGVKAWGEQTNIQQKQIIGFSEEPNTDSSTDTDRI